MPNVLGIPSQYGLEHHHLVNPRTVFWNLFPPALVEHILARKEASLAHMGAVVVDTGQFTGRSPNDKFFVNHDSPEDRDVWWGTTNRPLAPDKFERLYHELTAYLQGRDLFVQDMLAGAHPDHQLPIRIVTETAWHSLFARNLFLRVAPENLPQHVPQFTILHAPGFSASPERHGVNSPTFIVIDFHQHIILIGGTAYAGEVKKSIFTILNALLPRTGVLSMHCSANVGASGDVALFFGLSGTGKTTLSSDLERQLIGDDEHGWGDQGVFNFEGGCYAKTIHLRANLEPLIWEATRRFGTVLENVVIDPETRMIDFDNGSLTENTRAAYPIDFVPNHVAEGYAGHPRNIFFLSADAFGVMPPIARLTPEQARFYFLSGYTSKLAGTEKGLGAEPQATFSTCFGAPFLPLHPTVYSRLLGERIASHAARVWLVNTGWTGGPYGVGQRIHLPYTRAMVKAALNGGLDGVPTRTDPVFGLEVPTECPGVPAEVLDPRQTWPDPAAYDAQARALIAQFRENFTQFEREVAAEVRAARP